MQVRAQECWLLASVTKLATTQAAAEAQEDGNLAKALEKLTEATRANTDILGHTGHTGVLCFDDKAFQIGNVSAMMLRDAKQFIICDHVIHVIASASIFSTEQPRFAKRAELLLKLKRPCACIASNLRSGRSIFVSSLRLGTATPGLSERLAQ